MRNRSFLMYLIKFAAYFCLFYFGTLAVIGLSTPGNYYISFVERFFDFITPLRNLLLTGSKLFLLLLGYSSSIKSDYILSMDGGGSIRMVYSCIGYGVMSFWMAFTLANNGTWKKKLAWILAGLSALLFINILRLSLLLLSLNKHWSIPFGWDHHTWFNIAAYLLIFFMIYLYDRSGKKRTKQIHRGDR